MIFVIEKSIRSIDHNQICSQPVVLFMKAPPTGSNNYVGYCSPLQWDDKWLSIVSRSRTRRIKVTLPEVTHLINFPPRARVQQINVEAPFRLEIILA